MAALFRKLTRAQLARFLPSPDLIRAFEQLQDSISETQDGGSIPDGSITLAQLAPITSPSLLGRGSPGSGPPEVIQLGTGLTMVGTTLNAAAAPGGSPLYEITCTWLGLGVAIDPTFTELGFAAVPVTGTIVYAKLLGSILGGSAVADVWKSTYAASPPTVANSIVGAAPPTVTAATKSLDTILPGWTPAVTAGDTIAFKLNSCSTFTSLKLILGVQPP